MGASHGFNTVHGRMPSVMTGANLANRDLIYMGVSGDGDSASIGLGQFAHIMRRGVNMTYIVMNNGVYGLTKGQFSATADKGSISKKGVANSDELIDLVSLAILMGATFVGRSFSGDKHQLVPLIKAAMDHKGAAFLDVISPCVAFNNHSGSTKSYDYVREHNEALNRIDFIEGREEITTQYDPGTLTTVQQHDGSILRLRKLGEEYDPVRQDRRDEARAGGPGLGRGRDRPALRRSDAQGPAPPSQHGRGAAQHARHARPLPRPVGARADQRQPALTGPAGHCRQSGSGNREPTGIR